MAAIPDRLIWSVVDRDIETYAAAVHQDHPGYGATTVQWPAEIHPGHPRVFRFASLALLDPQGVLSVVHGPVPAYEFGSALVVIPVA